MAENSLSYILQILTILITLTLGLISVYQTRKNQRGQNIISVTTNYRLKRTEQLKEFSQSLMTNTNPQLLELGIDNFKMLHAASDASEAISTILHRYFDADRELIDLADNIVQLAFTYSNSSNSKKTYYELIYKRDLFKIKSDIYNTADWNRIKRETDGINTSSESWIKYYEEIYSSFEEEINNIKTNYDNSIKNLQE